MSRQTNQELCDAFRKLLTDGAEEMAQTIPQFYSSKGLTKSAMLEHTKPWRSQLWKAFAEIERRLCPQPENKTDG